MQREVAALLEAIRAGAEPEALEGAIDPVWLWARAYDGGDLPEDDATAAALRAVEAALPDLVPLLARTAERTSGCALSILRRVHDTRAVPPLIAMLASDAPPDVRASACEVLGRYARGSDEVEAALLRALDRGEPEPVRVAAAREVWVVGGERTAIALELLACDDPGPCGDAALVSLAWRRSDVVAELAGHPEPQRRARAVELLGWASYRDHPLAGPALDAAMRDPDPAVREAAARAIANARPGG